jgi:hypothetical protein
MIGVFPFGQHAAVSCAGAVCTERDTPTVCRGDTPPGCRRKFPAARHTIISIDTAIDLRLDELMDVALVTATDLPGRDVSGDYRVDVKNGPCR